MNHGGHLMVRMLIEVGRWQSVVMLDGKIYEVI
jgi:hypothetical protein